MNAHELQARRKTLIDEAEALATKPGATAEELAQADAKLAEADQLATQIATLQSQEHRQQRLAAARASIAATPAPQSLSVAVVNNPGTAAPGIAGNDGATLGGDRLPALPKTYGQQLKVFKDRENEGAAFGYWILSVVHKNDALAAQHFRKLAHQFDPKGGYQALAHSVFVPADGGWLVPEGVGMVIRRLLLDYGVMRNEAELVPMGDHEVVNSPIMQTGLRVYAAVENAVRTESQTTWGNVELISRDWAILTRWSKKLDQMAVVNMADTLAQEIAYQFALNEDVCCFLGDGTATYQGIVGVVNALAAGSIFTAATGNTTFGTIDLADFVGTTALLPGYQGIKPKWYMSRQGWALSMQALAFASGLVNPAGDRVQPQFLGYPVVFTETLPKVATSLASTVVALFGDMRLAAKFGDREKMRIDTSTERYFDQDQIALKGENSFAFNLYRPGDATTAGPIVALTLPSS